MRAYRCSAALRGRVGVTSRSEWSDTAWEAGTFHHPDFGIELTTDRDDSH